MIPGQRIGGGAVAEPPQPQHRLPEPGQRPSAFGGAAPPAPGQQQLRNELRQFPWDVKRGTRGDHVEPSSGGRSCGETSSTGAPRPFPDSPVRPRVCLDAHLRARESPAVRTYFAEITSLSTLHFFLNGHIFLSTAETFHSSIITD